MPKKVAIFWPGDYRAKPNEWALTQSREATAQLVAALNSLPPGQQAEFDSLVAQVKNPVMAAALLSNLGNGTTVPEIKQALEAGEIIS